MNIDVTAPIPGAARAAHNAGLCVLPVKENGEKRPDVPSWTEYQRRQSTPQELGTWFSNGRTGYGAVTGRISRNLEMFEFDNPDTYQTFKATAGAVDLGPLVERIEQGYSELTPGGGVHWYYRCADIDGNLKLARRADGKVLIETRGEGGFVVLAPSHGAVHSTGKPYQVLHGSVATIADITPIERELLHGLACSFDQTPPREVTPPADSTDRAGNRPGDDYNARATWEEVLEPRGWVNVYTNPAGVTYWRRPGKDRGWSATTNYAGRDILYVFSSSVTPLEPNRGYRKFTTLTFLEYGGDFKKAASELVDLGYGRQWAGFTPGGRKPKPTDLATALARIEELEQENNRCGEMIHLTGQHFSNPNLTPTDRIVLFKLAIEAVYQANNPHAIPAKNEGYIVIRLTALAEWCGSSTRTVSKCIDRCKENGLLDKQITRIKTEDGTIISQRVCDIGCAQALRPCVGRFLSHGRTNGRAKKLPYPREPLSQGISHTL